MRGLIPSIWLCEIERKTHRPISHLFNMIAGTSTGAILAAALTLPKSEMISVYSNEHVVTYR